MGRRIKRQLSALPDQLFPTPHRAVVVRYEREGGQRTVTLQTELTDSAWPTKRSDGQYTRYQFARRLRDRAARLGRLDDSGGTSGTV